MATTQLALGETSDHSENALLVVIRVRFFSCRRLILFSSVSHWSQRMLAEKAEVVMVDGGGEREGFWR